MLINNRKISGPSVEVLVFPRQDGDIVFKAKAILDYDVFDKLVPRPVPPTIIRPGGEKSVDPTDKKYQAALDEWAELRTHYMMITSLSATDSLVWETIKPNEPKTWGNYSKELKESGFSEAEITRIIGIVVTANGLDQSKIDEATKRFLAGQQAAQGKASSPSTGQSTTPSGAPVKD